MNNMQSLMAQAQRMQRDITKKQEEINKKEFIGKSGWLNITMNGKKEIKKIDIIYDGDLNEDKEMLADMMTIAFNDAIKQIETETKNKMGMYSSMLDGLM